MTTTRGKTSVRIRTWLTMAGLATMSVAVGAAFAAVVGNSLARSGSIDQICERDRCPVSGDRCEDAANQETNCAQHDFGCGTRPCGEAGTMRVLATFPTDESVAHLMSFGPRAIRPLASRATSSDYGHHAMAVRTLTAMVTEWGADNLKSADYGSVYEVAVRFTRHALEHVDRDQRIAALRDAVDLALAFDDEYLKQSVQLLADPETVRKQLVDDTLSPDEVVAYVLYVLSR